MPDFVKFLTGFISYLIRLFPKLLDQFARDPHSPYQDPPFSHPVAVRSARHQKTMRSGKFLVMFYLRRLVIGMVDLYSPQAIAYKFGDIFVSAHQGRMRERRDTTCS